MLRFRVYAWVLFVCRFRFRLGVEERRICWSLGFGLLESQSLGFKDYAFAGV